MTFDEASAEPDQKFELVIDSYGVHEYPIKYVQRLFFKLFFLLLKFFLNSA